MTKKIIFLNGQKMFKADVPAQYQNAFKHTYNDLNRFINNAATLLDLAIDENNVESLNNDGFKRTVERVKIQMIDCDKLKFGVASMIADDVEQSDFKLLDYWFDNFDTLIYR